MQLKAEKLCEPMKANWVSPTVRTVAGGKRFGMSCFTAIFYFHLSIKYDRFEVVFIDSLLQVILCNARDVANEPLYFQRYVTSLCTKLETTELSIRSRLNKVAIWTQLKG